MARLYQRGKKWWADYRDHTGRRVRRPLSTDKDAATMMLGRTLQQGEKLKAGAITTDPREAVRPFEEHRDDYVKALRRAGRDDQYVRQIERRLKDAAQKCGWDYMRHVRIQDIRRYLDGLAAKPLSAKTIKDARADLSAFFRWCVRNGRMEANPVERIEPIVDRREKTRRALSPSEIEALLEAAPTNRRLAYLFLAFTGLRRGEAKALRWSHVHLDGSNPNVELPASITKSGRAERVPLIPALVDALRAARGADEEPVFPTLPRVYTLHKDLKKAGIAPVDGRGRQVVLHSLRHSLATMLAVAGVPMVLAQQIMRHRDIRLTAQVYTDEALLPLAAAMKALPVPSCARAADASKRPSGAGGTTLRAAIPVPDSGPPCAKNVAPGRHAGAKTGKAKNEQPVLVAGVGNSWQEGVEWAQQDSNL